MGSIAQLLVPNNYDLFANSLTLKEGVKSEMFSAYLASNLTLSTTAPTTIIMSGTLIADPNYNTVTGQYTVPSSGIYLFDICVGIDLAMSTAAIILVSISIQLNGVTFRSVQHQFTPNSTANNHFDLHLSILYPFAAGNVIQVISNAPTTSGVISNYDANTIDTYWSVIEQ